jgi:hypothetical protein
MAEGMEVLVARAVVRAGEEGGCGLLARDAPM